jgi:hypothetical protein
MPLMLALWITDQSGGKGESPERGTMTPGFGLRHRLFDGRRGRGRQTVSDDDDDDDDGIAY